MKAIRQKLKKSSLIRQKEALETNNYSEYVLRLQNERQK